jgi:hypothetical protein
VRTSGRIRICQFPFKFILLMEVALTELACELIVTLDGLVAFANPDRL